MRTPDEIMALFDERSENGQSRQAQMEQVALAYMGRLSVPLPELDRDEKPAVANFIMQAIEQKAMRIASVYPETRTFAKTSQGSDGRKSARERKLVYAHFDEANHLPRKMHIRARFLSAYSVAPIMVLPDSVALKGPKYHLIDPRGFYPAQDPGDPSNPIKEDAIQHTFKTWNWLERHYPEAYNKLRGPGNPRGEDVLDWIVYTDSEQITTLASTKNLGLTPAIGDTPRDTFQIANVPNRLGEPLVISPGGLSITMEPMGRYDQVVGMYRRLAELDALYYLALRKSIFAESWVTSNPGEMARVVQRPDPAEGDPGIVHGGRIEHKTLDPAFSTRLGMTDQERAIRLTGMIPSEFGGELPTNARTARQGGRLLSNVIDFDVREAQVLLEESRELENKLAAKTDKKYFGGFSKTVEVNTGGALQEVTYDPEKLWATFSNRVSYAMAGADVEGTVIGAGQRMSMETLSRESFMEVDPMVRDVEQEKDRIASEQVRRAFLARVQQEANLPADQSNWTTTDFARYVELVESDAEDIISAYAQVNAEAQERQAEAAQAAGAMADPAAQPGVAGAEVPAEIAPPGEGQQNLVRTLGALRLAQNTVPGEVPQG